MNPQAPHIPHDLLAKYVAGECTQPECQEAEAWIQQSDENQAYYESLKSTWEGLATIQDSEIDVDAAWNKVHARIHPQVKAAKVKPLSLSMNSLLWRAAAVILLFLAIGISYRYLSSPTAVPLQQIVTAAGEQQQVQLPDESKVYLAEASSLSYPVEFETGLRPVQLEGKAFFEISSDSNAPFIVETSHAQVEVLGTSFQVSAYAQQDSVEVAVMEGKVRFSSKGVENKLASVELEKGTQAILDWQKAYIEKTVIQDPNLDAWKSKKLSFVQTPLWQVAQTLTATYGVPIEIRSPEIRDCQLTSAFTQSELDNILLIIQSTFSPLQITRQDSVIIFSGNACE